MNRRSLPWLVLGWFFLCAPTPGAVGSCGKDELAGPADFMSYCQQREELICTRRFLRKEITAQTRDACRWDGVDACARRSFPSDCRPTKRETQACLTALASLDDLNTPDDQIPECNEKALCTATPSEQAAQDAGADAVENPAP